MNNHKRLSVVVVVMLILVTFTFVVPRETIANRLAPAYPEGVSIHQWSQYQGYPTVMVEANNTACFLQSVTGKFKGSGEGVWIEDNGDYWLLNGKSEQKDVAASALCLNLDLIRGSGPYPRVTSSAAISAKRGRGCGFLEACPGYDEQFIDFQAQNSFCYLTGMGGHFYGEGEWVYISKFARSGRPYNNNDRPRLVVSTQKGFLQGVGACIWKPDTEPFRGAPKGPPTYRWKQEHLPVQLPNVDQAFCVLNYISGRFEGSGEKVAIFAGPGNSQWLGGQSQQNDVSAWATCLPYTD